MRVTTLSILLLSVTVVACGGGRDGSSSPAVMKEQPAASDAPPSGLTPRATAADAASNLETTPLSAADYALYANIMGGASALLGSLSDADREALAFARTVDAGAARVTPATEGLLARARALQTKDEELARLQGIDARYRQVKAKVDAVIGPHAVPPAATDAIGRENLRYLEAHRATIERLQGILRDPLSKPALEK